MQIYSLLRKQALEQSKKDLQEALLLEATARGPLESQIIALAKKEFPDKKIDIAGGKAIRSVKASLSQEELNKLKAICTRLAQFDPTLEQEVGKNADSSKIFGNIFEKELNGEPANDGKVGKYFLFILKNYINGNISLNNSYRDYSGNIVRNKSFSDLLTEFNAATGIKEPKAIQHIDDDEVGPRLDGETDDEYNARKDSKKHVVYLQPLNSRYKDISKMVPQDLEDGLSQVYPADYDEFNKWWDSVQRKIDVKNQRKLEKDKIAGLEIKKSVPDDEYVDTIDGNFENGYEIGFEDEDYIIYIPHTFEASQRIARNAENNPLFGSYATWCTGGSESFFDRYRSGGQASNAGGEYYIIVNKHDPDDKYQFNFETNQPHNKDNRPVQDLKQWFIDRPNITNYFVSQGKANIDLPKLKNSSSSHALLNAYRVISPLTNERLMIVDAQYTNASVVSMNDTYKLNKLVREKFYSNIPNSVQVVLPQKMSNKIPTKTSKPHSKAAFEDTIPVYRNYLYTQSIRNATDSRYSYYIKYEVENPLLFGIGDTVDQTTGEVLEGDKAEVQPDHIYWVNDTPVYIISSRQFIFGRIHDLYTGSKNTYDELMESLNIDLNSEARKDWVDLKWQTNIVNESLNINESYELNEKFKGNMPNWFNAAIKGQNGLRKDLLDAGIDLANANYIKVYDANNNPGETTIKNLINKAKNDTSKVPVILLHGYNPVSEWAFQQGRQRLNDQQATLADRFTTDDGVSFRNVIIVGTTYLTPSNLWPWSYMDSWQKGRSTSGYCYEGTMPIDADYRQAGPKGIFQKVTVTNLVNHQNFVEFGYFDLTDTATKLDRTQVQKHFGSSNSATGTDITMDRTDSYQRDFIKNQNDIKNWNRLNYEQDNVDLKMPTKLQRLKDRLLQKADVLNAIKDRRDIAIPIRAKNDETRLKAEQEKHAIATRYGLYDLPVENELQDLLKYDYTINEVKEFIPALTEIHDAVINSTKEVVNSLPTEIVLEIKPVYKKIIKLVNNLVAYSLDDSLLAEFADEDKQELLDMISQLNVLLSQFNDIAKQSGSQEAPKLSNFRVFRYTDNGREEKISSTLNDLRNDLQDGWKLVKN